MISKKDIIRIVDHIIRRSQGYTDRREMHPAREWVTGLIGVFVLFVLSSSFAGYKLYALMQAGERGAFEEGTVVSLDQDDIASILSSYEERKKEFESLRANRTHALQSALSVSEEGTDEDTVSPDETTTELAE